MMRGFRMKKFAHILIVLLSIYLSYIFTNIAVPRVQFFMDLANSEIKAVERCIGKADSK